MGGDVIRRESLAHKQILEDAMVLPIFTKVGWLDYFLKPTEFDNDIARRFVATLELDEAMVKGLSVDASKVAITQVSGLPRTGVEFLICVDTVVAREELCE